jgi:hypothetical protein
VTRQPAMDGRHAVTICLIAVQAGARDRIKSTNGPSNHWSRHMTRGAIAILPASLALAAALLPRAAAGRVSPESEGVKELFRFGDELALTDIELPVLMRFNLHQRDAPGAHLFVGPTFAFTMTAARAWTRGTHGDSAVC